MKQTKNNEMDLLLRGWARRSVASEENPTNHLDADELNSYAEQALPAATRARYTAHLADCETCRRIVSELTSASGVNVGEQSVSQETSAGLLQKVGALFSPGRLRYAVAALSVLAFIAVGWVVFRQQTQSEFVASIQPSTASRQTASDETNQSGLIATPQGSVANNNQRSYEQTKEGKDQDNFAKGDARDGSKTLSSTDSANIAVERSPSAGRVGEEVAQPAYAPEPPPPAPKTQTTITESRTEVFARQKKEADKNEGQTRREQDESRAVTDDRQNKVARARPESGAAAVQTEDRADAPVAKRIGGAGAKARDEEAGTRTVSGRQFRRQGGVWIDSAYQPSSGTTIVTRGSEQFRALIADEPGIRDIATQLHGEVVVVWKGRAYRIR